MNINDYLIDQNDLDWQSLLEEWRWLLPLQFKVWLFTRTGDLFILLPEGAIHKLDVGSGRLSRVAASRDEAGMKIDEPEVARDWLMIPVVDQLVAGGHVLGPGQCYSYRMLPALGGTQKIDNRVVLSIREHFGVSGSLHRQISNMSGGTEFAIKSAANAIPLP